VYGYRDRLTRGERGVVQILAVDWDQARVCGRLGEPNIPQIYVLRYQGLCCLTGHHKAMEARR